MRNIWILLAFVFTMAIPSFAADTGGVSGDFQTWAGKKIFLTDALNVETLTGAKTLLKTSSGYQYLDPAGAHRNITLPAEADVPGMVFWIINAADAAENLVVKDDGGSTIVTVQQSQAGIVSCSGSAWKGFAMAATAAGTLQADGSVAGATGQAQDFGSNGIKADAVAESTGATGVTIDSVLIKDGGIVCADAATLEVDTVNEATAAAGVTCDSVLLKDGKVYLLDAGADHTIALQTSTDEAASYTMTIPDLAGNDTFAVIGVAQTFSGACTFSAGIVPSAITGSDASLGITGIAGAGGGAGGAVPIAGGAGNDTGAGGAVSLTGGASGAGATGNGGAASIVGGAAASTNGAGGALSAAGGAGAGTGAGGAVTIAGGASGAGATGNGGAISATGGAASSTNGAGGAVSVTGGAGAGTGAGGAITNTGGASGAGATGNGGAVANVGGAATSTNGDGGASNLTGGVATGTGTGGGITLITGASAGAGGTAGSISVDTGAAAGGTAGTIAIGGTNSGTITLGRSGQALTISSTATGTFANTGLKIFDTGGDHTINFTTGTDEAADYTLTVPDLAGNDTLLTLATAQTLTGVKTLANATLLTMGTGSDVAKLVGVVYVSTTAGANVDGGEDTLQTYSLLADSLSANGKGFEVIAFGTTAANGNTKTAKLYFGTTQLITTGAVAANDKDWVLRATVLRDGAGSQISTAGGQFNATIVTEAFVDGAEDETGALAISVTGESGAAASNDIVCKAMVIKWID